MKFVPDHTGLMRTVKYGRLRVCIPMAGQADRISKDAFVYQRWAMQLFLTVQSGNAEMYCWSDQLVISPEQGIPKAEDWPGIGTRE